MKMKSHGFQWFWSRKDVFFLCLSGLALGNSFFPVLPLPFDTAWIAIIFCGVPIVAGAVAGLVTRFDIKADVLVSLALLASVAIGETFAAGEVAFIMQIGSLLEDRTVARARAGMERLVHLTPRTARLLQNGKEAIVAAESVQAGMLLRVLPGETIPVDGVILFGETAVDQSVMTGESLPIDKGPGDSVASGTVNQFGSFDMKTTRPGQDSSLQRMIRLVQSADAGKAKIVGLADRWATWIVVGALASAAAVWGVTGEVIRAVTILVVFCPCALVLATPTAITAAIGNLTHHGILVREGDALERLARVSRVAFDKTGTLTYGKPQIAAWQSFLPQWTTAQLENWTARAERRSEHPLGKAIVEAYQSKIGRLAEAADEFQMLPGRGITAKLDGHFFLAGNLRLLQEYQIELNPNEQLQAQHLLAEGCTLIYLAVDGQAAGFAALSDTLRSDAPAILSRIRQHGVRPVLLTGDNEGAARHMASILDIEEVIAGCMPQDKMDYIQKQEQAGQFVCMVGDGVNDAPALKQAHVGIAMGGAGSDIAIDAADMALIRDDIRELPHLFGLSRRMMKVIRWNLAFSMGLNFLAIILAALGILHPVLGALVHNAGSVFVIIHSAFLLTWQGKNGNSQVPATVRTHASSV